VPTKQDNSSSTTTGGTGILPTSPVTEDTVKKQSAATMATDEISGILPPIQPSSEQPTGFTSEHPQGTLAEPAFSPASHSPAVSQHPRIFLDVCAGSTRPLSQALLKLDKVILSIDILLCSAMGLLDDQFYLQLMRVCASGIVAYTGCSPSCAEYSRLKLETGGTTSIAFARPFMLLHNLHVHTVVFTSIYLRAHGSRNIAAAG